MKVTVSKNEYNHTELTVRKHKKIIAVSTLVENVVSLETYHLISYSVDHDLSLLKGSGLSVGWSKKGADVIDFRDDLDKEKVDILVDGHRISTHNIDKMNFSLDLVVYYISSTKEEK
jgi:hypothetical protein